MGLFEIFEIKGQTDGLNLLITAGVHGDEYEGIEAIRRLIAETNPSDITGKLTLIPVVNVSAHGLDSRCGEDELDLARTCPGKTDGSITERVAAELTAQIAKADLYIDLHTGGKAMQVDPLSGYMLVKNPDVLETQRRMARAFGLPVIWGTSGALDGRSLSAARDAEVPAIYTEYLGGENCSETGVEAYLSGCREVMAEFDMLPAIESQISNPELEIEDPRPDSGHLQIHHCCPADGIFEATVSLGQNVHAGDEFGRVGDSIITADSTGRVICLRVIPEVKKGECLGVILESPLESRF